MNDTTRGRSLLDDVFTLGPHAGAHRVAARAGLSVFVPLTVLVLTDRTQWTAFAAFGAFTSLYGRSSRYAERTSLQISIAGVLVGAVTAGAAVGLLPQRSWWIVGVGAVLAAVASVLSDAFHWHPPGPLFVVFAFTVCATMPPHPSNIPIGFAVCSASAAFSVLVGHLGVLREPSTFHPIRLPHLEIRAAWQREGARLHLVRFFLGVACAGALGVVIGTRFGGSHPYWAMVAAVAGLSGPTRRARLVRGTHRLLGTLLGVGVAGLVLAWHPRGMAAVVVITAMQVGAELLVGRNYALALLCITPLALMMGQIVHEAPIGALLLDRAGETLIGCAVALAVLLLVRDRPTTAPKAPGAPSRRQNGR